MTSMTGFAAAEWMDKDISLTIEMKGYNHRFLEITVNTSPWLSFLEQDIRRTVSEFCGRGKIEVYIRIKEKNPPIEVSININAAKAYKDAIFGLASSLGIEGNVSASLLIGMEGVLEAEKNRHEEHYWKALEPVLIDTACKFREERSREGKFLEQVILEYLGQIETKLKIIEAYVPNLENNIKENIKTRFKEISGNEIDENRVLAETAILLMKYTISEEISRLWAHLCEFKKEAANNDRPGKKLDFLCQEINREINTIGSKSNILEVSQAVVEMKESLENIREQLRNIE
ncbi:MAG: YicC family protein [Treponema sp.]|nr:YicC family protein [Treponema sp.]